MTSVLIIGTGLIGTSIGLALGGRDVWLSDTDPGAARLAAELGAGTVYRGRASAGAADIAVLAVPPDAVAGTLAAAQRDDLARFYTDVASVKQLPVVQARAAGCDMSVYVPGHPLAGREKHGPAAARADLFLGRTWAICPAGVTSAAASSAAAAATATSATSAGAVEALTALVIACGAVPVITDPQTHDRWVALTSHAPHVVSAAMAARLADAEGRALDLAGQGLRDVTRIAAGDTALWTQILSANAGPVAAVLAEVAADLAEVARLLADGAGDSGAGGAGASGAGGAGAFGAGEAGLKVMADLLDRGRAGVERIPGKHGTVAPVFAQVQVVIKDQPGELTALFDAAGAAGVNIEDVRIEHSPGLPVGVAELSVRPDEKAALLQALQAGGWTMHTFRRP